ncbi:MAG: hypothetical protein D6767_09950 [Candidatus Hydrogenedentota bacterium]|nr:MAG: hypothetical protein D6767_09950 [Candidatus Hydrogenedentota bacterium]
MPISLFDHSHIPDCSLIPSRLVEKLPFSCTIDLYLYSKPFIALRSNLKVSLEHRYILKQEKNYLSQNNSLTNIEIDVSSVLLVANVGYAVLFPPYLSRYLWRLEKNTVKNYFSLRRRLRKMNPIPGYVYSIRTRSPAFPFIYVHALDQLAADLSTYPFTDDLNFRMSKLRYRSFSFIIVVPVYDWKRKLNTG